MSCGIFEYSQKGESGANSTGFLARTYTELYYKYPGINTEAICAETLKI